MKKNILSAVTSGGVFVPGKTALHRMGPGIKLVLTAVLILTVALGNYRTLTVLAVICGAGLFWAGETRETLWRRLKALFWLILVVAAFPMIFLPGVPVQAPGAMTLPITWEGLEAGLMGASRLALILFLSMILMRTTPAQELIGVAEKTRGNIPWIGQKLREPLLVGILAFEMIPHIASQAEAWSQKNLKQKRRKHLGDGVRLAAQQAASFLAQVFRETGQAWREENNPPPDS